MSQSPWSTVMTCTPMSPRTIRAACESESPRSPRGVRRTVGGLGGAGRSPARRCPRTRTCRGPRVPSTLPSLPHSVVRLARRRAAESPSVPAMLIPSTESADMAAAGPLSDVGSTPLPSPTACTGLAMASRPISRLSQPTRVVEPALASSISSMAAKCDRLGAGRPGGVDGGELAGLPQRQQRRQGGVQAEHAVAGEQLVGGDGDARACLRSRPGRRGGPRATARRRRPGARAPRGRTTPARGRRRRRAPRLRRTRPTRRPGRPRCPAGPGGRVASGRSRRSSRRWW